MTRGASLLPEAQHLFLCLCIPVCLVFVFIFSYYLVPPLFFFFLPWCSLWYLIAYIDMSLLGVSGLKKVTDLTSGPYKKNIVLSVHNHHTITHKLSAKEQIRCFLWIYSLCSADQGKLASLNRKKFIIFFFSSRIFTEIDLIL